MDLTKVPHVVQPNRCLRGTILTHEGSSWYLDVLRCHLNVCKVSELRQTVISNTEIVFTFLTLERVQQMAAKLAILAYICLRTK